MMTKSLIALVAGATLPLAPALAAIPELPELRIERGGLSLAKEGSAA